MCVPSRRAVSPHTYYAYTYSSGWRSWSYNGNNVVRRRRQVVSLVERRGEKYIYIKLYEREHIEKKKNKIHSRTHTFYTSVACCFDRFLWICLDLCVCVKKNTFLSLSLSISLYFSPAHSLRSAALGLGICPRLFYGQRRRMIIKWIREFPGHGRQEKRIYSDDAYNERTPRRRRVVFCFWDYYLFFRQSFVSRTTATVRVHRRERPEVWQWFFFY